MSEDIKRRLLHTLFRFKRIEFRFMPDSELNMGELMVLGSFMKNNDADENICIQHVQRRLNVTKPAISQILNSLEKKGYISREIDHSDRRKFIINPTPKGYEVMLSNKKHTDFFIAEIVSRFGEENTNQLIDLFERFHAICNEIKNEKAAERKGEEIDD